MPAKLCMTCVSHHSPTQAATYDQQASCHSFLPMATYPGLQLQLRHLRHASTATSKNAMGRLQAGSKAARLSQAEDCIVC